ncbi:MAG: argininosuccinate lyase [Candidatus Omnitrophota bacterium]|jgi:argininosuccinate lyase
MDKKLWGGRFTKEQDDRFWKFQCSIGYDKELALYDIQGSMAHVKMLSKCGIIPRDNARSILKGLKRIQAQAQSGVFSIDKGAEDIHSAVYIALKADIGPAADYMHTARSRNDQVCLDMRMYVKDKACLLIDLVKGLQLALALSAKKYQDIIMPGLTHTQHAMPVLLAHQLLAYVEMLQRDKARLEAVYAIADEMPLGSCAMAGTSFKIDRQYAARLLGFSRISHNSIDAVSDRDFILDMLYAISLLFMHISRFCEDMILLSTEEFGLLNMPEQYCTGSSIMPQKKNPDALELLRGSSAQAYANLHSVMVLMKGLPLSYNRDMQLDKEPLFGSVRQAEDALIIAAGVIKGIKPAKGHGLRQGFGGDDCLYALDMAEYLVKKGLAFKQAHDIIGRIVACCIDSGIKMSCLPMEKYRQMSDKFDKDIYKIFCLKRSVASKISAGGTSPELVRGQIGKWLKRLSNRRA